MHDRPCRMGPMGRMGGRRGWRHRQCRGPCGDRAFERGIPIDITEENDSIQILADVPGASKESIQIEVDKGVLTIDVLSPDDPESAEPSAPPQPAANEDGPIDGPSSAPAPAEPADAVPVQKQTLQAEAGDPAPPAEAPERRFIVQQRPTTFAKRFVQLPEGADALKAEATCTNGVLTITMPREVPDSKKRVPVA